MAIEVIGPFTAELTYPSVNIEKNVGAIKGTILDVFVDVVLVSAATADYEIRTSGVNHPSRVIIGKSGVSDGASSFSPRLLICNTSGVEETAIYNNGITINDDVIIDFTAEGGDSIVISFLAST